MFKHFLFQRRKLKLNRIVIFTACAADVPTLVLQHVHRSLALINPRKKINKKRGSERHTYTE